MRGKMRSDWERGTRMGMEMEREGKVWIEEKLEVWPLGFDHRVLVLVKET